MADKKTEPDIVQGHCPECGPGRFADIRGDFKKRDEDDDHGIWFVENYRILQCRGCGTAYFQRSSIFSEDLDHRENPYTGQWEPYIPETISYWPSPTRRSPPDWLGKVASVDTDLGNLMNDVYGAFDADLRVPAAIALRTAFDRSSELLGVDPAKSFAEKLNDLQAQGKISGDEKTVLTTLTDAGNAAAHRAWRPSPSELDTMASIIESFIHRTFVLGDAAKKLQAGIPPRPSRKPKRS
jgi:hypothetical protein